MKVTIKLLSKEPNSLNLMEKPITLLLTKSQQNEGDFFFLYFVLKDTFPSLSYFSLFNKCHFLIKGSKYICVLKCKKSGQTLEEVPLK